MSIEEYLKRKYYRMPALVEWLWIDWLGALIKYCDAYFKDDYEAESVGIENEENQRLAEIVEENSGYQYV